ncbi:hypothetical protein JW930_07775 [Candidatus Woesearchaeota archaeon]|nr:hypothetical protein [Candidatus Woesearchaeota archaeon]
MEQENKIKKKRRRRLYLVLLIIVLAFFLPILFLIEIEYEQIQLYNETVPVHSWKNLTYEKPVTQEACFNISYDYSVLEKGINHRVKDEEPYIVIQNSEENWGVFITNFSFFDDSKYPYEQYEYQTSEELDRFMEVAEIEFTSRTFEHWIGPGEMYRIETREEKPDSALTYWALAHVFPPQKELCYMTEQHILTNENTSTVEYKVVEKQQKIVRRTNLISILLRTCDEWFFLILLLVIIVLLVLLLVRKYWLEKKTTK